MILKDSALDKVSDLFKEYAGLLLNQLNRLEQIVQMGQVSVAEEQLAEMKVCEKKINDYEVKLTDQIINVIVLHNPMASDVRKIMAAYRMAEDMERIGDNVYNIARLITKIKEPEIYNQISDLIYNMLVSSIEMVEKAILSFVSEDKEDAVWAIKNDEVVDRMNKKLMKRIISKSDLDDEMSRRVNSFINFKSIISKIERIGDHATNIAEASIYSMEGRDLRHKKLED